MKTCACPLFVCCMFVSVDNYEQCFYIIKVYFGLCVFIVTFINVSAISCLPNLYRRRNSLRYIWQWMAWNVEIHVWYRSTLFINLFCYFCRLNRTVHQLLRVVNVSTLLKIVKFRIRYYICMHINNQSLFCKLSKH
jgi:hypothetical protein